MEVNAFNFLYNIMYFFIGYIFDVLIAICWTINVPNIKSSIYLSSFLGYIFYDKYRDSLFRLLSLRN